MGKDINKTPGYMYVLVAGAILIASFAAAVGLRIIEIGQNGLIINLQ